MHFNPETPLLCLKGSCTYEIMLTRFCMTVLVALAKRSENHNRSSGGDCPIINYGKLSTNVIP